MKNEKIKDILLWIFQNFLSFFEFEQSGKNQTVDRRRKLTFLSMQTDCLKFSSKRKKAFLELWLSSRRSKPKWRKRRNWTTKKVSQSFSKKSGWVCTSKLRTLKTLFSNAKTSSTLMQWICLSWRKTVSLFVLGNLLLFQSQKEQKSVSLVFRFDQNLQHRSFKQMWKRDNYSFRSFEFSIYQKNFSHQKDNCKRDQRTPWKFRLTEFSFQSMNARMCHRNLCMFFDQASPLQLWKGQNQWRHSFARKDSTWCFLVLHLHEQCRKNAWVKASHTECWVILIVLYGIFPLQIQSSSETLTNRIQTNHWVGVLHQMLKRVLPYKLLLLHFELFWYFLLNKNFFQHWSPNRCFLLQHFIHKDLLNEHFRMNLFQIPRFSLWRQIIRANEASVHKKRNAKKKRNMWPLKKRVTIWLLRY